MVLGVCELPEILPLRPGVLPIGTGSSAVAKPNQVSSDWKIPNIEIELPRFPDLRRSSKWFSGVDVSIFSS